MLRIVHPPRGGKEPVHSKKGRSPSLMLTDAESLRLRAAVKHLHGLFGSWACLADAMGVKPATLHKIAGGRRGSAAIVLAASRAAGMTVERMLAAPSDA